MGLRSSVLVVASLLAVVAATLAYPAAAQTTSPKVVLELFTSQGCSSCPPADALMETYLKREDVIALSLPVDYWDRLGWKDTFASSEYTARQRDYAATRGDGQVYTPQMVVGGASHVIGSIKGQIENAIAATKKALLQSNVPIQARFEGDTLVVDVGSAAQGAPISNGRLLLAVVRDAGTVSIRGGENASRTVTYYNIVRSLKTVGTWTGEPMSVRLPKSEYSDKDVQSLAVLLQIGRAGPIVGATQIRLAGQS